MPFGEEIYTGVGARSAGLSYGTSEDDIRQKFTGYLRDTESSQDFAINRFHVALFGRFTQVDPYNIILEKEKGRNLKEKSEIFTEYILKPQIWNRYL